MEKNIKNYLHLYLGCECRLGNSDLKNWLTAVQSDSPLVVLRNENDMRRGNFVDPKNVKPILRPLGDMTENEKYYNNEIDSFHSSNHISQKQREAERTLWLLSKHFDLFNLIDAGLAIDATILKTQTA